MPTVLIKHTQAFSVVIIQRPVRTKHIEGVCLSAPQFHHVEAPSRVGNDHGHLPKTSFMPPPLTSSAASETAPHKETAHSHALIFACLGLVPLVQQHSMDCRALVVHSNSMQPCFSLAFRCEHPAPRVTTCYQVAPRQNTLRVARCPQQLLLWLTNTQVRMHLQFHHLRLQGRTTTFLT